MIPLRRSRKGRKQTLNQYKRVSLGLGYLWCLVDRRGRYWHDYLSGTELILLPKREKSKKSDKSA